MLKLLTGDGIYLVFIMAMLIKWAIGRFKQDTAQRLIQSPEDTTSVVDVIQHNYFT